MRLKLGLFEFEGTPDELGKINILLEPLIKTTNKIVQIVTSTTPTPTVTTAEVPVEVT